MPGGEAVRGHLHDLRVHEVPGDALRRHGLHGWVGRGLPRRGFWLVSGLFRLLDGEVVVGDVQAHAFERALHCVADMVFVLAGEVQDELALVGAFEVVVDAGGLEAVLYLAHGRVVELQLVQVAVLLPLQSFLGHLAAVDLVLDGLARGVHAGLGELHAGTEQRHGHALGDSEHELRASGDDGLDGVLDLLLSLFLDWHCGFLSVVGWCFLGRFRWTVHACADAVRAARSPFARGRGSCGSPVRWRPARPRTGRTGPRDVPSRRASRPRGRGLPVGSRHATR